MKYTNRSHYLIKLYILNFINILYTFTIFSIFTNTILFSYIEQQIDKNLPKM